MPHRSGCFALLSLALSACLRYHRLFVTNNMSLSHLLVHLQVSQQDLFLILLGIRATPSSAEELPLSSTPAGFGRVTSPESVDNEARGGRSFAQEDDPRRITPPIFSSNASSPSTAFSNTRLKPPPTPRSFWDTPVGRSLEGSSAVGWTRGAGERGVSSQGTKALSNPAELGAADRENTDASSLDPTVDGSCLDGVFASAAATATGEEEAHFKPGQASPSLTTSSPHATTVSSANDGPVPSGTMKAVVKHTDASQNTKHEEGSPGGEVPMGLMTAQGTGTKAVRSLSRTGGGEGGEEVGGMGREAPATISESGGAFTSTYVANSCGELPSRR